MSQEHQENGLILESREVTSLTSLLEDNENSGFVFHMTHQCNLTFRITQLEDDVSECQ